MSNFNFTDIQGRRFGRLVARYRVRVAPRGGYLWKCVCDCGNEITIALRYLRQGGTKSCGCLRKERRREVSRTHGHSSEGKRTPEYQSWRGMISRCLYKSDKRYADYGGRGVTVCDRWNVRAGGSFENFLADMGPRPIGTTLDRINNNLGYEKENCKWSTPAQQAANRRKRDARTLKKDVSLQIVALDAA